MPPPSEVVFPSPSLYRIALCLEYPTKLGGVRGRCGSLAHQERSTSTRTSKRECESLVCVFRVHFSVYKICLHRPPPEVDKKKLGRLIGRSDRHFCGGQPVVLRTAHNPIRSAEVCKPQQHPAHSAEEFFRPGTAHHLGNCPDPPFREMLQQSVPANHAKLSEKVPSCFLFKRMHSNGFNRTASSGLSVHLRCVWTFRSGA